MENIDKLPKWAQQRIRLLERQVTELKEIVAQRNGEVTDGLITLNPFDDDNRLIFPTDTTVRFYVPGKEYRGYVEVGIKPKDGAVEIHGSAGLVLTPRVTNVVSVRLVDW